jgi:hypothetical protein
MGGAVRESCEVVFTTNLKSRRNPARSIDFDSRRRKIDEKIVFSRHPMEMVFGCLAFSLYHYPSYPFTF